MKDIIKEIVLSNVADRELSFADINNILDDNKIECLGDNVLHYNHKRNLVSWANMSNDYCLAIIELFKEDKISARICSSLIYEVDGLTVNLPIAVNMNMHKEPHWIPSLISTIHKHKCLKDSGI